MTEGAVSAPAGAKVQAGTWLRRQSSALLLIGAVILGSLLSPLFTSLEPYDVAINGRLSLVSVVWLIVALVLCAVILRARSRISRDLGEATQQWLASMQDADGAPRSSRDATADTPSQGAALVRGILNLALLLVAQGVLRTPVVALVSEYAPRAWVDGGWVVLVFLVALMMLFGLHRVGKPLAERVIWLGLDQLVPTAGFAGRQLPSAPSSRTKTSSSAAAGSRPAEATRPAGAVANAPAETTVPAPASSAEATRLAPADVGSSGLEATVLAPSAARLPTDSLATIAETPATSGDATMLAPTPMPQASSEATVVAPTPAVPQSSPAPTVSPSQPPTSAEVGDARAASATGRTSDVTPDLATIVAPPPQALAPTSAPAASAVEPAGGGSAHAADASHAPTQAAEVTIVGRPLDAPIAREAMTDAASEQSELPPSSPPVPTEHTLIVEPATPVHPAGADQTIVHDVVEGTVVVNADVSSEGAVDATIVEQPPVSPQRSSSSVDRTSTQGSDSNSGGGR